MHSPIIIPDFLLKSAGRRCLQYNDAGQGTLHPERLAEGESKAWSQWNPDADKKEYKTLVISDWSLGFYQGTDTDISPEPSRQILVQMFLQDLAEMGFPIYFLQDDDLVAYSPDLNFAEVFEGIAPRSPSQIIEIASDQLPPGLKDIAVLDYVRLRELMRINDPTTLSMPTQISSSDLQRACSRFPLRTLLASLDARDVIQSALRLSEPDLHVIQSEWLQSNAELMDGKPIHYALSLCINQARIEVLNLDWLAQIKKYPIDDLLVRFEDNFTTEAMREAAYALLLHILEATLPTLTTLKLDAIDLNRLVSQAHPGAGLDFSTLQELTLYQCIHIESLINKTTQLCALTIESAEIESALVLPSSLQSLHLDVVAIKPSDLLNMLMPLCKLAYFDCNMVRALADEADLPALPTLVHMRHCSIADSQLLRSHLLKILLEAMPALQSLVLNENNQLNALPPLMPHALEKLQVLDLENLTGQIHNPIADIAYLAWIKRPKALRFLRITLPETGMDGDITDILSRPNSLRQLYLHPTTERDLSPLWVYQAEKLQHLTLHWVDFEIEHVIPARLASLIGLHLVSPQLSEEDLAQFLSYPSQLSSLVIEDFDEITAAADGFDFYPAFSRLNECWLGYTSDTLSDFDDGIPPSPPQLISRILAGSPHLRMLACIAVSLEDGVPLNTLHHLQILEYIKHAISAHTLERLLSRTPRPLFLNSDKSSRAGVIGYLNSLHPDWRSKIAVLRTDNNDDEGDDEAVEAEQQAVYSPHSLDKYFHQSPHSKYFNPERPPPKSYAQAYIIHCFCQYETWIRAEDEDQEELAQDIAHYQKGLCANFVSLFLTNIPENEDGGIEEHPLVYYFDKICEYSWQDEWQKPMILLDPEIRHFFNQLHARLQEEADKKTPSFAGVFQPGDLHQLIAQHRQRWQDTGQAETHFYLRNSWHRCGLILRGTAAFFYDPNQPEFYHPLPDGSQRYTQSVFHLACLHEHILEALGPALMVCHDNPEGPVQPSRPPSEEELLPFIQNGGLFFWARTEPLNWRARFPVEGTSPAVKEACLTALFLRNTNYQACLHALLLKPDPEEGAAVIESLSQWLNELGDESLHLFKKKYKESLTMLKPSVLEVWRGRLNEIRPILIDPAFSLCTWLIDASMAVKQIKGITSPDGALALHESQRMLHPLILHYSNKTPFDSQEKLDAALLTAPSQHILLEFASAPAIRSFLLEFQGKARTAGKPCFVIRNFEALRCARDALKLSDDHHTLCHAQAPQGDLFDFIAVHRGNSSLLFVVDWSAFQPKEIIRANTLIDEINARSVDGVPLPRPATVIGCVDHSRQDCYLGQDFLRRHQHHWIYSFPLPEIQHLSTPYAAADSFFAAAYRLPSVEINLYESVNWKALLLGKACLNERGFQFEPGPLCGHCLSGRAVHYIIKNPPWQDPEFRDFWDELQLHNAFTLYGRKFSLPALSTFSYEEGYTAEDHPVFSDHSAATALPALYLSPSTLAQFFSNYTITPEGALRQTPGFLELARGNTLNCHLTRDLPPGEMALFLKHARNHHVMIHLIDQRKPPLPQCSAEEFSTLSHWPETLIISVDELNWSDLMDRIHYDKDSPRGPLHFQYIEQALLSALRAGKTVVLKGPLSAELMDRLTPLLKAEPLWINNQFEHLPGRLLLAAHSPAPAEVPPDLAHGAFATSFTSAHDFETAICNVLLTRFATHPLISVAGPTGGGKTHFFRNAEVLKAEAHVYFGEDKISAWAESSSEDGKPLVLVIDEANLHHSQWTCFEDLFNPQPSLYIHGKYYPLSPHHRVVFIGNPHEYGGERGRLPVLERHPASFSFPPLPPAYLREKILAPILTDLSHADDLIARYQHAASFRSKGKAVAASPRDLQMMAMAVQATGSLSAITPILDSLLPKEAYRDFTPPDDRPLALLALLLQIRTLRTAPIHQTWGLSALSIVGEAGAGKSHFVEAKLKQYGASYVKIPATWPDEKKYARLIEAFHAGEVVLLEEINSAPLMERLLNALLSGYDLEGNLPRKAGFTLIATSNPPSAGGDRTHFTPALERRFLHAIFPPPSPEKMFAILQSRNRRSLPNEVLKKLIQDHETLRASGKPISLGDLINIVDPPDASAEPEALSTRCKRSATVAFGGAAADSSSVSPQTFYF